MSYHGPFAERLVREIQNNERRVLQRIQSYLGEADISAKQIKVYLLGIRDAAESSYREAMGLFSPATSALLRMRNILAEAATTVEDINALQAIKDAIGVYDREYAQQTQRHLAFIAIAIEENTRVPAKYFAEGQEPHPEEFTEIGERAFLKQPALAMLLCNYPDNVVRDFLNDVNRTVDASCRRSEPLPFVPEEFGRFMVSTARNQYSEQLEKGIEGFDESGTSEDAVSNVLERMRHATR